jgi:hypothetical protein
LDENLAFAAGCITHLRVVHFGYILVGRSNFRAQSNIEGLSHAVTQAVTSLHAFHSTTVIQYNPTHIQYNPTHKPTLDTGPNDTSWC